MATSCTFDGAAQPNPGQMGLGFTIGDETIAKTAGYGTNNEAEYLALISLLQELRARGIKNAKICGDSQIVICQVTGEYTCGADNLRDLCAQASNLIACDGHILSWHARSQNDNADRASRAALEGHEGVLDTATLKKYEPMDMSQYTTKIGELVSGQSAVKTGKAMKALGMRAQDGNPIEPFGINILYHGFWTTFWHIKNCQEKLTPKTPDHEPQ